MFKIFFISFLLINGYTNALTEDEIKINFFKLVTKCHKDHPVDMREIANLHNLIAPEKTEVKCLLACAYKLEGIMTKDGFYDLQHAYEVAETAKNGDNKRLENGKKVAEECVKVNDIEVKDGTEGCERAGLIFRCVVQNAPKYGFTI